MNMKRWLAGVAVIGLFCSGAFAQVTGKCTLDGKPPEMPEIDMSPVKECNDMHPDPVHEETIVANAKGELANVIVSVKKEDGVNLSAEVPKTAAVIAQHGCQYVPHVLPVMIGQAVVVKNDDECMHNVHSLSSDNPPFNFAQTAKDDGKKLDPFTAVETFRIKCDVHPWMTAYIRVFDHPYFATSKADGTFSIAGLPDGDYTFVAWQERMGEVEVKGTVKGGKANVDFVFKSADAKGPDAQDVKVSLIKIDPFSCPACMTKPYGKNAEQNDNALATPPKAD